MSERIRVVREGLVARVLFANPPVNVIDIPMMQEILGIIDVCNEERLEYVRVLQFEAAPECRAFSSGVSVEDHLPPNVEQMLSCFHAIFRKLTASRLMTLAAVRGFCLGGGAELACFCDAVVASEEATFGFPEIRLGAFAPVASVLLPELVGLRRTMDWLLSGRYVSAHEAKAAGLIDRVVPEDCLEAEVRELRDGWLSQSSQVLPLARQAIRHNGFEERLDAVEQIYREQLLRTADAHEGMRAFLERRSPRWS